jgi:CBS domain-containing protein
MIYALPWKIFSGLIEKNPKVALFFAAGFASGLPIHTDYKKREKAMKDLAAENRSLSALKEEDALIIDGSRKIVSCSPESTIHEAARIMSSHNVGSVIITDAKNQPLGIITDTDLRKKVIAERIPIDNRADSIMSSPVFTIHKNLPVADIILHMMNRRIRHLVITENGTLQSPATGIVTEHDVLLLHGNNPAVLVKEMHQAKNPEKLASVRNRASDLIEHYLDQEISVQFIAGIITEINDALISQAVALSVEKLSADGKNTPDIPWCWLSLGSEGRKEQLLRTDQDNALLYSDPAPGEEDSVKKYFTELALEVNAILEICGFEKCPSDIMAGNPKWCNPLSEWKKTFHKWIAVPEPIALLNATIFFDFRTCYGDDSLTADLRNFIDLTIEREGFFLPYLAKNAMENPPPLSFMRNLIVERSGEHKNQFDIKLRGMMPLADAARVLCLDLKIHDAWSTFERFRRIAEADPSHARIAEEASIAYGIMMRFRALNGNANHDSGRYIDPEKLGKIDRQTLRNSFQTIEDIQSMLRARFPVEYIR